MQWLTVAAARVRAMVGRRRFEEVLDEELRTHLEMLTDDYVRRGIPPEEARYAALRALGGVEQVKEQYREQRALPMIETLVQDVRYGLRQLRRNPGFTVVAVLTLALGIGANTAIFSVVDAVLLRSMRYKDPSRLVVIWETYQQFPKVWVSVPNFRDWQEQTDAFEAIGGYHLAGESDQFTLTGHGEPQRIQGTFASANLFGLLGVRAALGRVFVPAEDEPGTGPVVVLSYALWQRLFASDPRTIGRNISLSGKSYTVVGIMPPNFRFPDWAELWMPLGQMGRDELASRVYHPLEVVGRLKAGVTLAAAQAQINTLAGRLGREYPKTNGGWRVTVIPLREELLGKVQPALLILFGATGLVLLIACANVASLTLARASAREKEMAVRAALGAGRPRLIRQLLSESLTLSGAGGALGLLLALWGRDLLAKAGPAGVPSLRDVSIDGRVLAFSALISILTGLIFGLVPAFQSSTVCLSESLQRGTRTGGTSRRTSRLRGSVVVIQLALALIVLTGAGLLVKSFVRLVGVDPGFSKKNLLTARIDLSASEHRNLGQFFEQISDRLRALPGVKTVGLINDLPLSPEAALKTRFVAERSPLSSPGEYPVAELRLTGPDYFRAMGIPLLKGRYFRSWAEEQQLASVIINETMARRFFPHQDPLGQRLNLGPEAPRPSWVSIIGVAGDVRDFGLANEPQNDIYFDAADSSMYVVLRTASDPSGLASAVRRVVQSADPDVPVTQVVTGEELVSGDLASRRFSMGLLGLFAGMALILSAIGIYGVISYGVAQRTHEIGIRMALGAERVQVLNLVVRQGLLLTCVGVAIGLAGAFGLSRFLATLLYDVKPTDPATFGTVSLVLAAVALLASFIPARRATKVDPMVALRYE
jgi:putative ABC transport system permease protein